MRGLSTMNTAATILAITSMWYVCVAQAEQVNNERLVSREREKRQVGEWPINLKLEKALLFIEEKRKNASDGEAFTLMTRTYEKCDKDCMDGTYLKGPCSMDCREYYLTSRVNKLENQIVCLIAVIIVMAFIMVIGFLGTCFSFYKKVSKMESNLRDEIKQQKLQGHPTFTPHQPAEEAEENAAFIEMGEDRAEREI